eukprot:4843178-Prymnesium_polylepis.1
MLHTTLGYNHTGLEAQGGFGPDFNIGYIFIRHTAVEFVQNWRDACFRSPSAWDQQLFASVLRRGEPTDPTGAPAFSLPTPSPSPTPSP